MARTVKRSGEATPLTSIWSPRPIATDTRKSRKRATKKRAAKNRMARTVKAAEWPPTWALVGVFLFAVAAGIVMIGYAAPYVFDAIMRALELWFWVMR